MQSMFRTAFGQESGVFVEAELTRALSDSEYPAAIIQFDSGDIRPRVAGDDPRGAEVVGLRHVYRYFLDISTKDEALPRLSALYDQAIAAAQLFNAAAPDMVMVYDGAQGIARSDDMTDDIRSIRLRFRVEGE